MDKLHKRLHNQVMAAPTSIATKEYLYAAKKLAAEYPAFMLYWQSTNKGKQLYATYDATGNSKSNYLTKEQVAKLTEFKII